MATELPRRCASAVMAAARTGSLAAVRLKLLNQQQNGVFRFPFGRVRYTDASALSTMYEELFVSHIYAVDGLGDQPCIVDCGGNIGLSVVWFKQRYPEARITVFEADPALAEILAENIQRLRLTSVEVVKAAVGGAHGPVKFARHRPLTGYIDSEQGLPIECVRLSDRVSEPVDLLKVDIEGSEFGLLQDLCMTGKIKLVRHLICEVHGSTRVQDQMHALWTSLSSAGFALTIGGAETNERLPGPPDPTPFTGIASGKFILFLYGWQRPGTGLETVTG